MTTPDILTPREQLVDDKGKITRAWWRALNNLFKNSGSLANPLTVVGSAILNPATVTSGGTISSPSVPAGTLIGNATTTAALPRTVTIGAGLVGNNDTLSVSTIPAITLMGNPTQDTAVPTSISLGANLFMQDDQLSVNLVFANETTLLYANNDPIGRLATLERTVGDAMKAALLRPNRGTVTEIDTGTGLTGGPITDRGTVSFAAIADADLLANTSGGSAAPIATTLTALIDYAIGNVQGDVLYRSASAWAVLAPGSAGKVLTSGGPAANPSWTTAATGTVTNVATGTGLTGGPITTTGTISLAAIANHDLLANTSGGSAAPVATTLTALIDDAIGTTQGDILYRSATAWTVLAPGSSGNVLQSGGAGADPSWVVPSAGSVTSVATGTGLTGGTITSTGTVALAAIASHDILSNITGGSAAPVPNTVSDTIDAAIGAVQGDILYRSASAWSVLAPGTSGNFLTTGGAAANPSWTAGNAGTVTNVATGAGLTGGPITATGTVALAAIANLDVLANISGGSAAPSANTVTAVIDAAIGSVQGDILYRGAATWSVLAPGAANTVLQSNGAAANPAWSTLSALLDAAIGSAQGDILYRGSSAWSVLTPGTAGQYLQTAGASANPTWGTVADVGRNYVGNPLFWVAQRGAGPFTTSAVYTLDRWQMVLTTDTMSVTQDTLSDTDRTNIGNEQAETGLANAWTSAGSNASFNLVSHKMEDVYRLANKTVTVSFWAKAAAGTPKVGVNFTQHFGTGGGPSANVDVNGQSVTLSTTFARYQLTFSLPSVAGKTIGSSNTDQTQLHFWYSSGTTNATLAGIGVQASGTITLWGVQCEIGSVATPLEIKGFAEELADCERFYIGGAQVVINGYGVIAAGVGQTYSWATRMRGVPTITITSTSNTNVSGFTVAVLSNKAGWFNGTVTATGGWTVNATFTVTAEI